MQEYLHRAGKSGEEWELLDFTRGNTVLQVFAEILKAINQRTEAKSIICF